MTPIALTVWDALGANAWNPDQQKTATICVAVALAVYGDHTRDQGTPYIHHPVAVVAILRDELDVTCPTALMTGLLHDALEIDPGAAETISSRLGGKFTARLAAITPDHRLADRPKQPGDQEAWHRKTEQMPPVSLTIRLADRIHNLRDLANSPDSGRRARFLADVAEFHLPLAESRRGLDPHLAAAHALLLSEYNRYQREELCGEGRVLHGADRTDRREGLPPHGPQRDG
ncbi:HD domain-containing protein [Streptomyces goshikiensis]